eukprot:scaffold13961_cov113-Skeletonema_dohrnii-CCMP3373.AAC.1
MTIAVKVRLELKPYKPFSIEAASSPTSAATAVPTRLPTNAATAEILEQSMMPTSTKTPEMILFARKTCPTPLMDPAKKALAVRGVAATDTGGSSFTSFRVICFITSKNAKVLILKGKVNGGV